MCVCAPYYSMIFTYIMVIYTHPNTAYPKVSTLIKLSTGVQMQNIILWEATNSTERRYAASKAVYIDTTVLKL